MELVLVLPLLVLLAYGFITLPVLARARAAAELSAHTCAVFAAQVPPDPADPEADRRAKAQGLWAARQTLEAPWRGPLGAFTEPEVAVTPDAATCRVGVAVVLPWAGFLRQVGLPGEFVLTEEYTAARERWKGRW